MVRRLLAGLSHDTAVLLPVCVGLCATRLRLRLCSASSNHVSSSPGQVTQVTVFSILPPCPAACLRSGDLSRVKAGDVLKIRLRQWPEVSDFVARFCTLCESENTRPCENRTRNTRPCENCTRNVCFLTRATGKNV